MNLQNSGYDIYVWLKGMSQEDSPLRLTNVISIYSSKSELTLPKIFVNPDDEYFVSYYPAAALIKKKVPKYFSVAGNEIKYIEIEKAQFPVN